MDINFSGWDGTICRQWSCCLWSNEFSDAYNSSIWYLINNIIWNTIVFSGNFFSFQNWIINIYICRKCNWSCPCFSKQMDRFYLFNIFSLSLLSLCSQLNSNLLLILTIIRKSADNIFTLQHWCSNNFPQAKEELEQMYKDVSFLIFFLYVHMPQASSLCTFTFLFFIFPNHGCTGV